MISISELDIGLPDKRRFPGVWTLDELHQNQTVITRHRVGATRRPMTGSGE
jgi:hypothetical protein